MTLVSLSDQLDGKISPSFGEGGLQLVFMPTSLKKSLTVTVPSSSNPHIFAHRLWRAGMLLSDLISREKVLVRERRCLELGSGAGLPGLTAALCGASLTILTDYNDPQLIETLRKNVNVNLPADIRQSCAVLPLTWGSSTQDIVDSYGLFDDILCADVLWDAFSHDILCKSILALLARQPTSRVHLVCGFHTGRKVIDRAFNLFAFRGLIIDGDAIEMHVATGKERLWQRDKADEPIQERNQWLLHCSLRWAEET